MYLPNDGMYPDDVEGTVDGVHPNDWGMMHMAKAYGGAVGKALFGATAPGERSESFRIRDPFVFADVKTRTYYLYGVEHYIGETNETTGVWVRKSKDLETWSEARRVMVARRGTQCVWAPEVHEYKGAYYMFATLKDYPDKGNPLVMMGPTPEWTSNVGGLWNSAQSGAIIVPAAGSAIMKEPLGCVTVKTPPSPAETVTSTWYMKAR